MNLRRSTRIVQDQLLAAASLGDDSARRTAELLAGAVEPALRLALQEALAQCADELTAEIAPDRIELALHGSETGLRFVPAPETATSTEEPPARAAAMPGGAGAAQNASEGADEGAAATDADEATARLTFRPPQHLKQRLEAAAAAESLSLNAYLVRALTAQLDQPAPAPRQPRTTTSQRISGWYI